MQYNLLSKSIAYVQKPLHMCQQPFHSCQKPLHMYQKPLHMCQKPPHMGQFLQDEENEQNLSFFGKNWGVTVTKRYDFFKFFQFFRRNYVPYRLKILFFFNSLIVLIVLAIFLIFENFMFLAHNLIFGNLRGQSRAAL